MKRKARKSSGKQKVSAMLLKVAAGYIDLGKTKEQRENYLRSACSAWNIACLPRPKREPAIRQYLKQFQTINQADESDCRGFEEDLRKLIEQKDKLYPNVDIPIIGSQIKITDGREQYIVISARTKKIPAE
ncbi:hypothetical protein L21SP3_01444 [Sedimentisphaera cyanobacteriorum]|uniref:Uncharacterized protein n=1 Tax=Sedimentisphaera cyanobacteriorum TaxID=1940790 RepID=A0A1Q2HQU5_9BACT|nr:hypothetical protein [Sedimentisphaera cyanobacteriorum]AQQ09636.1 hypothetical protein L21SP3_01444 [Sedimentisphaera cyanobacteriorum]